MKNKSHIKSAGLSVALLTVLTLLAACASSRPATKIQEGIRIPFELDSHHHVILTFYTDENIPLHFNFDSGCPDKKAGVTFRGFKKLQGSDYESTQLERESYFFRHFSELTGKEIDECTGPEIDLLKEKHLRKLNTDFTTAGLVVKTSKGQVALPPAEFSYCPAESENYGEAENDGTIGFAFFGDAKRITFNYKEGYVELDGAAICGDAVALRYFSATGHYFTPVTINGQNDYALLDTGSEVFTLREPVFDRDKMLSLMDDEKLTFSDYYKEICQINLPETDGEYNNAESFILGKVVWENVRALKITDRHMHTGPLSRLIIASSNNIGYPFFKDKILQFDLENMLFRIVE